jgi:HSP20 family protein
MFSSFFSNLEPGLYGELRRFENEIDQLFGRSPSPAGIRAMRRGSFPAINVGATPDRVDVYVFAAGLDPKSIDVSIQQNLLAVSGSRQLGLNEEADYYRRERFDGDFRRVITLPEDVDPERVDAKYSNGVLQITLQRRETARPRQIEVK